MSTLTLVFIGLAAFIIWRLYSVLGTRTGNERPHTDYLPRPDEGNSNNQRDNVLPYKRKIETNDQEEDTKNIHPDLIDDEVKFPWAGYAEEGSDLAHSFDKIKEADPHFHPKGFIEGATRAYEMIITAFADGDKKALKPLLSEKVYEGFATAIDAKKKARRKTEMTFIGVQNAKITEATIDENEILLTVRFSSELISATYDNDENLVEGDPNKVNTVVDIWRFSRPLNSHNPNWYLMSTRSS